MMYFIMVVFILVVGYVVVRVRNDNALRGQLKANYGTGLSAEHFAEESFIGKTGMMK